jgi:hypothetical protein
VAEELVQEAFLRLHKVWGQVENHFTVRLAGSNPSLETTTLEPDLRSLTS